MSPKQKRSVNDSLTERIRRLCRFKFGKEKARERQDNETLESNSKRRERKERREKLIVGRGYRQDVGWERGEESLPEYLQYDDVLRRGWTANCFSNEVESMKERSDPTIVDQNAMLQRTQGRRATVAWNMLAELLEILVFQAAEHKDRKGTGLDTRTHAKKGPWRSLRSLSTSLLHFLLSCMLLNTHQSHGTERKRAFIPEGTTAERCTVVTVVPRIVGQADQRKTKN